jgi:hypothetical protein
MPSGLEPDAVAKISATLSALLADVFALYVKTKNFHNDKEFVAAQDMLTEACWDRLRILRRTGVRLRIQQPLFADPKQRVRRRGGLATSRRIIPARR